MNTGDAPRRSIAANAIYGLLNPLPFGFFVAALVFDILYARSAVVMWGKSAAWLIVFGLLCAVIPRLINLVQVWVTLRHGAMRGDRFDFWCNLLAIVAATFNAFVHSRDAYAVIPAALWLSAVTVVLLAMGRVAIAIQHDIAGVPAHE
ncbi:hypothetical protein [Stenotrophomonas sp. YIM B06876]|uniref:hypothetical protein n=1 Tax=Stenotrophomonas sp. YIM B06876 TaxID=3060211 RepID=UPI0027385568|nr:hypothetical protein [Stenotrophomonas sp. YIM B06876]